MVPSVKRYERAHVDFEQGRLRIGVADRKAMTIYFVAGNTPPPTPDGYSSTSYSGNGLAHYFGGVATKFSVSGEGRRDTSICYLDLGGCASDAIDVFLPAQ
jgi:hypothetical protein